MGRNNRWPSKRLTFSIKKILSAAAAVIILLLAVRWISLNSGGKVISYGADSRTYYRTYGSDTLQYTKDRAVFYNSSWEQQWSDPYTMESPIAVERDKYTAIFETGGRSIKVYNEDGPVYSVQTSDPIQSVSLAENGYVGVISSGSSYMVSVYSLSGSLLFQRVEADSGVYPMCCDISPDGESIVIGYMDTTGIEIKSKIGLFYVDADMGADYTDSMYAAVEKEDEIIFRIYYMSGSEIIAVGDRHIISLTKSGTEQSSAEVTNEICGVGICGKKIALVYGEELSDKDGQEPGTAVFVSSGGKLSYGDSIGGEPDYFAVSKGGMVLGKGSVYYGISSSGRLCWSLSADGGVTGIYPTSSINKCVYAARAWAVSADMRNFEPSAFDPDAKAVLQTITADGAESGDTAEATEGEQNADNNSEEADNAENNPDNSGDNAAE